MNISKLALQVKNPPIYEAGTDFMWTHPHISKQLLSIHLNPDVELASRRMSTIEITVEWIETNVKKAKLKILDLGCGPGLYCEKFAQNGHDVTGVDISENSIAYAKDIANKKLSDVTYICNDYTKVEFDEEQFDLVIMIYTDFGVLKPEDQQLLLKNVNRWLKPGGKFIFDVMAESGYKNAITPKSWEIQDAGFWRDKPYIYLGESIPYEENKVILSQNIVIDDDANPAIYRFWTQFFSKEKIYSLFESHNYSGLNVFESIIEDCDFYSGKDIYFIVAEKKVR